MIELRRHCPGLDPLRTVAGINGAIKARGEVVGGEVSHSDSRALWLLLGQRLYRGPHLLWRCFGFATINHLQQSQRIDVFRDRVRLLLCFDPIQNSRYSGLLLHRVKPCLFGLLKMFLFEIGAAI